jgi:probable phosphomutase (TIGR03848 family)
VTLIYLVRHAENDYLTKGKLAGWIPGVHLNDRGRKQAEAIAEILSRAKPKAIYASPLERAMETAEPLAEQLGKSVIARPGLGEIQYGKWEGVSLKLLRRRKLWPVVQSNPSLARFPNGESFVEAQSRVVSEIESLRANHRGKKASFVCVSHADILKLLLAHFLGMPIDLFQRLIISPASISMIAIDQAVRVISINDLSANRHLHSE